jgi:hypothetical protein
VSAASVDNSRNGDRDRAGGRRSNKRLTCALVSTYFGRRPDAPRQALAQLRDELLHAITIGPETGVAVDVGVETCMGRQSIVIGHHRGIAHRPENPECLNAPLCWAKAVENRTDSFVY